MSISADPTATVEFDAQTVTGKTIPLKARFLTWRERKKLNALLEDKVIGKFPEDEGVSDACEEAIRMGIVNPDEVLDQLTPRELATLAVNYRDVLDLSEIDRGKSSSLLRFTPAKPAQDAAAVAATSPMNQAP